MLRRFLPTAPLLALVALSTVACEVQSTVEVVVDDDGAGTVEAAVGLDADALGKVPDLDANGVSDAADLAALVRVDDMRAAGWTVDEPAAEDDGLTWIRATKPFGTPDEAVAVLSEVTGAEGALRDLELTRSTSFGETSYDFTGTLDLSGGLEAFGDAGLAEALDGEPLGEDAAAIEQDLGQPLADTFTLDLRLRLPGDVDPGTGELSGADVVWSPDLGAEAEPLEASSTARDMTVLAFAGAAVVSGILLVLLLVFRLVRR
jgi:hypothetical protein